MTNATRRTVLKLGAATAMSRLFSFPRSCVAADQTVPMKHPGLLHTAEDFARIKARVAAGAEPWKGAWDKFIANPHASLKWKARPAEVIVRGKSDQPENYPVLYKDIATAYTCGLRWRISGDNAYADKAVQIMNAWSSTLKKITGSSDRFLAAGIYGYEFANAAEILREYPGWKADEFKRFQQMMLDVFGAMNIDFLTRHNGAKVDHYFCNWDACNMSSLLAIGVLCDKRELYDQAVDYFKNGKGNGAIGNAVVTIHPGGLGQFQESGRDQGHCTLCVSLLGAFCEMAWNQGDDLYGHDNNRFLAGAEYVAKYNLGNDVPYTPYRNSSFNHPTISEAGRGAKRPCWELVYNHYVNRKGLAAPYCTELAEKMRPDGGVGDYGPNSGGYDQLGHGTLTFTREPNTSKPRH